MISRTKLIIGLLVCGFSTTSIADDELSVSKQYLARVSSYQYIVDSKEGVEHFLKYLGAQEAGGQNVILEQEPILRSYENEYGSLSKQTTVFTFNGLSFQFSRDNIRPDSCFKFTHELKSTKGEALINVEFVYNDLSEDSPVFDIIIQDHNDKPTRSTVLFPVGRTVYMSGSPYKLANNRYAVNLEEVLIEIY